MHLEWPWNREPAAKEVVDRRNEEGHHRNITPRRFPRFHIVEELSRMVFDIKKSPDRTRRSMDPKGDWASVGVTTPIAPHTFTYTSCECVFFFISRWCKRGCVYVCFATHWGKETDGERRWKSSAREKEGMRVAWNVLLSCRLEIARALRNCATRCNVVGFITLNFMWLIGVIFTWCITRLCLTWIFLIKNYDGWVFNWIRVGS